MKIEFVRHVFATLTYSRDHSLQTRWNSVSKDFNRYIQEMRRLHSELDYLRVVEKHKDGYPHVHIILQFPYASIRVENTRYFDRRLYETWKGKWKFGHSDYQRPRRSGVGCLTYLMKYLLKNQTQRTIWKKVFVSTVDVRPSEDSNRSENVSDTDVGVFVEKPPVRYLGVKLCTWSRRFSFEPFVLSSPSGLGRGLGGVARGESLKMYEN